jgi:hypothetical protein
MRVLQIKTALASLGVMLTVGCAPELPEGPVFVDPSFDAERTEAVVAAIDAWVAATDGGAVLRPVIDKGIGSDFIRVRPRELDGLKGRERSFLIWIDPDSDAYSVTLHELGHAIGLGHPSYGLMRSGGSRQGCIDDRTVRDACEILGDCGPEARGNCDK